MASGRARDPRLDRDPVTDGAPGTFFGTHASAAGRPALVGSRSGCEVSTILPAEGPLVGEWSWVEARGGIAGVTITPASTGQTIVLRFDDERVELVRNDELERTVEYRAVTKPDGSGLELTYDGPLLTGFESQTASLPEEDVLILTDPCCDGYEYRFESVP